MTLAASHRLFGSVFLDHHTFLSASFYLHSRIDLRCKVINTWKIRPGRSRDQVKSDFYELISTTLIWTPSFVYISTSTVSILRIELGRYFVNSNTDNLISKRFTPRLCLRFCFIWKTWSVSLNYYSSVTKTLLHVIQHYCNLLFLCKGANIDDGRSPFLVVVVVVV